MGRQNCIWITPSFFIVSWIFFNIKRKEIKYCVGTGFRTVMEQMEKLPYLYMDRFHAALPVSDHKILVCGGCSAIGALQDVHIFNTGEFVPVTDK